MFERQFTIIPLQAILDDGLPLRGLRLLGILGALADEAGQCAPSLKVLATALHCHRDTVRKALRLLEARGYIAIHPRWDSSGARLSNLIQVFDDAAEPPRLPAQPAAAQPAAAQPDPYLEMQAMAQNAAQGAEGPQYFSVYEQNIGPLTPHIADVLRSYADDPLCPDAWIEKAIREAAERGVRNLAYIRAILNRWMAQGQPNGSSESAKPAQPKERQWVDYVWR